MKKLLWLILVIVYIGHTNASEKYADIVEPMLYKTVAITAAFNIDGKIVAYSGSGVFISSHGHILTCYHLFNTPNIAGIIVKTYWGEKYVGEMIYSRPDKDLALIKIDSFSPRAFIVSTSAVRIGVEVLAIGHPSGLGWTVTNGILSGLHRGIEGKTVIQQHNAATSPGSSGGPLFNLHGELVGIHVFTFHSMFAPIPGLHFAVSTVEIHRFLDKLRGI